VSGVKKQEELVASVARVVKPGGICVFLFNNPNEVGRRFAGTYLNSERQDLTVGGKVSVKCVHPNLCKLSVSLNTLCWKLNILGPKENILEQETNYHSPYGFNRYK